MLRVIDPKEISFEWDRVRAGLLEVKETTSDDWLPEDAYMMIRNGAATLWIGEDEHGDYLGFLIMQLVPMFHASKLHIWCAYSATSKPLMREFLPQIKQIAEGAKAAKITFSSVREEWEPVSRRLGFKPGQMSYEMNL